MNFGVTSKLLIKTILLCLVVVLENPTTAYAQGQDEQGEPTAIPPTGRLNLTFKQLGYETKRLNRNLSQRHYRIDLPYNFLISETGNYLALTTSHFPEVPDKPSVLQIEVNGRLLTAFSLSKNNAISNTIHINLPAGLLRTGANYITIALDTSATCEDPGAIVTVSIDENSTLSFGYQQISYPVDLSLYPFPFTEVGLLKTPVTIVLPDFPTANDLSVAATIAAGLGQTSGGAIDLTAVLASDLGPDIQNNNHLIVIGKPDDNILFDALELPLPIESTTLKPGHGVLEETVSPWNEFRLILIVSGLDDEGMLKASHALNRKTHFLSMQGPVAVVTKLRPLPAESITSHPSSMTLASLGYEDQVVYGAAPQDYAFDFVLPLGWQLEASPVFVLKFSHANILDPYESVIDIKLNDVPIGSTLLDASNADGGELTLSLPRRLLRSGRNRLQIEVEMNFPASNRDKCRDLLDQRAWTVISNESEIFLPYNAIDLPPDLSLFPYPFSRDSGLDHTIFVLPDQPPSRIFNDLIQLAVRLGSPTTTDHLSVCVVYASEVDEDIQQSHHFILLGRPAENALFREINDYLPQPFVPDSDSLEPLVIDSVALLPNPDRDAGLLEIANSPWSEKYNLLAITGTTDEGVRLAVKTLLEQTSHLKGNLAVIEPVFSPLSDEPNQVSTYSIDTRSPASEEASTSNAISENDLALLAERWWK